MKHETKEAADRVLEILRGHKYVLVVLLVGLALLLIPTRDVLDGPAAGDPEPESDRSEAEELEVKLSAILSLVDGAGEVRVMLTQMTGGEQVFAADSQSSGTRTDTEESYEERQDAVIISTGSGTSATVPVKYIYPEFRGAIVVAEGADSANLRLTLTEAVAAVTGLPMSSIQVIKMR